MPQRLTPQQQPKLTVEQQREALALIDAGVSTREVGKRFGVSHTAIWRLTQNERLDSCVEYEEESMANMTGLMDSTIDTKEKGSGEDSQVALHAQHEEEERGK